MRKAGTDGSGAGVNAPLDNAGSTELTTGRGRPFDGLRAGPPTLARGRKTRRKNGRRKGREESHGLTRMGTEKRRGPSADFADYTDFRTREVDGRNGSEGFTTSNRQSEI